MTQAVLCDLRARAVKAIGVLVAHDEGSAGLAPLLPALAKVALEPAPQVSMGARGSLS